MGMLDRGYRGGNILWFSRHKVLLSPSFLICEWGLPRERESAGAGPTPLWGKRGGVGFARACCMLLLL